MTNQETLVAAVQLCSGIDPEKNVEKAIDLVRKAAARGAVYVQLPEYFNYLGPESNYDAVAESIPGPTTRRICEIAKLLEINVHIGSMLEISEIANKFYNTSVLIDATGRIAALYRKGHLFDINVPGEIEYKESDFIVPGKELIVAELPQFKLGMSICFDLRFPEMYRRLAANGATVFAIPSAFAVPTGKAHWEVLIRARAIENHAYVVAAAQVGTTPEGVSTYGNSMIVGPWGEVIALSRSRHEDLIVAGIDLGEVSRRRAQISVLNLRRPDLYESLPESIGSRSTHE